MQNKEIVTLYNCCLKFSNYLEVHTITIVVYFSDFKDILKMLILFNIILVFPCQIL